VIEPELQALLSACKDDPDEDAPRLVLADWLEDHGQAERAEFVRLQLRLGRADVPEGDEAVTLAYLHELYLRHADDWLGPLRAEPGRCRFRRGLIEVSARLEELGDPSPQAAPWLEALVLSFGRQKTVAELVEGGRLAPFTGLDATDVYLGGPTLERLGASPAAAHLRRLRVQLAGPAGKAAEALGRCRHLSGLKVLELPDGLADVHLHALTQAGLLANLTTLNVTFGTLTHKSVFALVKSASAPRLTRLVLRHVHPGAAALSFLVDSPVLADVRELRLEHGSCQRAEVGALGERREWPRLERLSFARSPLKDEGVAPLAGLSGLPSLRRLDLDSCELTAEGLRSLLGAPWLGQLELLRLDWTRGSVAAALAGGPDLSGLRHLSLRGSKIDVEGARALADSPHLGRLETLDLSGNPLGNDGLEALASAAGLPALTALNLGGTQVAGRGLARLAASRLGGQLRRLGLSHNKLRGPSLRALHAPALAGLRDLRLEHNLLDREGFRALAEGPFRDLVRLDAPTSPYGSGPKQGAEALFSTHGFPRLALLDLSGWDLGGKLAAALRNWPRLHRLACLRLGPMRLEELREFGGLGRPAAFCLE
jgi:uncharacterized protein (TIGR02996 family)